MPANWWMLCAAVVLMYAASISLSAVPAGRVGIAIDGKLQLLSGEKEVCTFAPLAANLGWNMFGPTASASQGEDVSRFTIKVDNAEIAGEARVTEKDGRAEASWSFVPKADVTVNCLAINLDIPIAVAGGGMWEVDGKTGVFPLTAGEAALHGAAARSLVVKFADGETVSITFSTPTSVFLQDNRQWGGQSYSIRIGSKSANMRLPAGEPYAISMSIGTPGGVKVFRDQPVTIVANDDWVPLKTELEIEPGSALDFSGQGFIDGPCGSKGRVIVTRDGHFAYADDPNTPRRFYGVNLCFSAQFLTKEQVDTLLDRLVRLGYNSVRIHHYESGMTNPTNKPGFDWDADKVDRLDYLIAGCAKRGLWLTTDLFVSRPVSYEQIKLPGEPNRMVPMDIYKSLVLVYEPAMQDFQTFSRKLLDRVNPYTGKRLADDPALAWISLINEGTPLWHWKDVRQIKEWNSEWNAFLELKYVSREDLAKALGDLKETEDPAKGTVALPTNINDDSPRTQVCLQYIAYLERRMVKRVSEFLRDDLNCRALITNQNAGAAFPAMQVTRHATYDYVDDHFYIDHPQFIQQPWRLPSRSGNENPIRQGANGASGSASLRIWGKPFTVTEFDYAGPGRFRGVGGILTGAMASLQDWDGIWRFAYAHGDREMFTPSAINYFNAATDPLKQAADRATMMLYLRRDLEVAPNRVEIVIEETQINDASAKLPRSPGAWFAWTTRIGTRILPPGEKANGIAIPAGVTHDRADVTSRLKSAGINGGSSDGVTRAETGQIAIDQRRGILTIDAPRTAGGYADAGEAIETKAGVSVSDISTGATVFVTSLDAKPIRDSHRLLVTHLTDLQNTGSKFAESARQTLLEWGKVPLLVRDGSATVRVALVEPGAYTVWALSAGGKRVEKIESKVEAGSLVFAARVRGAEGARMLYEVAR